MGIFDKLLGSKDVQLNPKSALALGALTVIAIDGSINDDEIMGLSRLVRGDRASIDTAVKVFKERKINECVDLVAKALPDAKQRKCVIANLIELAMADGILAGAERDLLGAYLAAFAISDDDIKSIVEVMALKNDLSVLK